MPGQPKTRMLKAKLDVIGVDRILTEIASGKSVNSIAKEINISRQIVSDVLNSPEYEERTKDARRQGAQALVDECLDIASQADPLTEKVAKLNISTRQWIASKYDKDRFGDTQSVVNISVGSLHLDSLRNAHAQAVTQSTSSIASNSSSSLNSSSTIASASTDARARDKVIDVTDTTTSKQGEE